MDGESEDGWDDDDLDLADADSLSPTAQWVLDTIEEILEENREEIAEFISEVVLPKAAEFASGAYRWLRAAIARDSS